MLKKENNITRYSEMLKKENNITRYTSTLELNRQMVLSQYKQDDIEVGNYCIEQFAFRRRVSFLFADSHCIRMKGLLHIALLVITVNLFSCVVAVPSSINDEMPVSNNQIIKYSDIWHIVCQ